MKIIFDYQVFLIQKYGGVSKYIINLDKELNLSDESKIIAPVFINKYLKFYSKTKGNFFFKNNNLFTKYFGKKINQYYTKYYLRKNKPDIVHFSYHYHKNYLKNYSLPKKIITIYDLNHEIFFERFFNKRIINYKNEYFNSVDHIICISENTKKDLLNFYKVDEKKISVIYLGVDKNQNTQNINTALLNKPYLLYVGMRNGYKNFRKFIEAYSKSDKLKKDFNVICFGGNNFSNEELKYFKNLNIENEKIIHTEGNDNQLNFLYNNAECFVFPSLYEGFGLPLLEAMNMNCPVACSNNSSFNEVSGDAAEKFNPENIDDIKNTIEKLVYNDGLKKQLIINSKKNLARFSWKKCGIETISVYKSLI